MLGTIQDSRSVALRQLRDGCFAIRLVIVALVFAVLTYNAVDTLVRAIWHITYNYTFSNGYWRSPAPTLGDAGWALLFGPVIQLAVAGVVAFSLRHRRRLWRQKLRAITWWLLPLDLFAILVIYVAAEAAVI